MAIVTVQGNANPTHYIEPNADGSVNVSVEGSIAIASLPALPAGSNLIGEVEVSDGTNTLFTSGHPGYVQGTVAITAASLPLPSNAALETGGNLASIAGQFPSASAKGIQSSSFGAVQQPKDSGRSKVILSLTKTTSITTEALVTLTQKKGDATTTTGTSYAVTAGKTLRIQSILLSATLTTAGITAVAIRLREGASGGGALSLTSDIISEVEVSANTATIGVSGQQLINFPDGLEITGGQIIGFSELATTVDAAVTIVLTGYEY